MKPHWTLVATSGSVKRLQAVAALAFLVGLLLGMVLR